MDLVSAAAKQQAQIGHGQAPHGSGSHAVHTANGHEVGCSIDAAFKPHQLPCRCGCAGTCAMHLGKGFGDLRACCGGVPTADWRVRAGFGPFQDPDVLPGSDHP